MARQPREVIKASAHRASAKLRSADGLVRKLQFKLREIQASTHSRARRLIMLRNVSDTFGAQIGDVVACKKGCNHCCHIAVTINSTEAEAIAKATGYKMESSPKNGYSPAKLAQNEISAAAARFQERTLEAHHGQPCTFLDTIRGICKIYEQRPLACRQHHTTNPDSTECDPSLDPRTTFVGELDLEGFYQTAALTFKSDTLADIRDFFPPKKI